MTNRFLFPIWACIILTIPLLAHASGDGGRFDVFEGASGEIGSMDIMDSYFIENIGQIKDPSIVFYSRNGGVHFTEEGVFFKSSTLEKDGNGEDEEIGVVLMYRFVGSNRVEPVGTKRCPWNSNYFTGNDPSNWRSDVPNHFEVSYIDLWDGIDLVYRSMDGSLKYDLLVHPGADPGRIAFDIEGARSVQIDDDGSLIIGTELWDILDGNIHAYQGDGRSVGCEFSLVGRNRMGFSISDYDQGQELIIDPLLSSTYIGGNSDETMWANMAVDSKDYKYIIGTSLSSDYPTTPGCYRSKNVNQDAVVTKFTPGLDSLVWSTFIGGSDGEQISDITVDSNYCAYITGHTLSWDFPTTPNAYDQQHERPQGLPHGYYDVYITKFSQTGSSLDYSTFLGGYYPDSGEGIVVDSSGCAYVTGYTIETPNSNFVTTAGAFDTTFNGGDDAFVVKLDSKGSNLLFSTLIGGGDEDWGQDLDLDPEDNVLVTGWTKSSDFPTTPGSLDRTRSGLWDAFAVKLNASGDMLNYSTFIGGSWLDRGYGIVSDSFGNAIITGYTEGGFPITPGAFDTTYAGSYDGFICIINASGSSILNSTYIGGSGFEQFNGISIDAKGNVYITGETESTNFPTISGSFDTTFNGDRDAFALKIDPSLSFLMYSTYLGGANHERGHGISINSNSSVNIAGYTFSNDFPTTPGAFDTSLYSRQDLFLSLFKMDLIDPIADAGLDVIVNEDLPTALNGSESSDETGVAKYRWTIPLKMGPIVQFGETVSYTFTEPGSYDVTLNVTDLAGNWDEDHVIFTVLDITKPVVDAGEDLTANEDSFVELNGSGSLDNVGITSWTWELYDGINHHTLFGIIVEHNFTEPGDYSAILNASDEAGNWNTDTVSIKVLDITKPTLVITDLTVDEDSTMTFNASGCSDNVGIVNYTWSFRYLDRPIQLYGITAHYIFGRPGTYQVNLMITDGSGNIASGDLNLTVLDVTKPNLEAGPNVTTEEDLAVLLSPGMLTDNVWVMNITWSIYLKGSIVTMYGENIEFTFTEPGIYPVDINATDGSGNWAVDRLFVIVLDVTPPFASAGDDIIVDEDLLVTFDGTSSTDNVKVINWTWSMKVDGTTVTLYGPSPTFTFFEPGEYTLSLSISDLAGNEGEDTLTVTVLDVTSPLLELGPDMTTEVNLTVSFICPESTSDNVGVVNWTWTIATVPTHTLYGSEVGHQFTSPGTFTVTLTVRDGAGNGASNSIKVIVNETVPADDDEPVDDDDVSNVDGPSMLIPIVAGILLLIIVLVAIVLFLVLRPKGKKEEPAAVKEAPKEEVPQASTTPPQVVGQTTTSGPLPSPSAETPIQKAERLRGMAASKGINIMAYEMQYNMAISMGKNPNMVEFAKKQLESYNSNIEKMMPQDQAVGAQAQKP